MGTIFLNLIKKIRKFIFWAWKQEGSPYQRACGFGLGVFSACFPFFGLQTLIGIFLAKIFNANRLLAALGTWISNPITYLPLYFFNYRIGSFFLDEEETSLGLSHITKNALLSQGWSLSLRLLIGSAVVALISGLFSSICLYFLLKTLSKQNKK